MKDNLVLSFKDIILRDKIEDDFKDYIHWYTEETDWQQWVEPWSEGLRNVKSLEKDLRKSLDNPPPIIRADLEIIYEDMHVGWVDSYIIDGEADKLGVQVVIPDKENWNKGIGEKALICFIRYVLEVDPYRDIFVEIWDGNVRMISLARKLGFEVSPLERITKTRDKVEYVVDRYKLTDENISKYRI